MENRSCGGKFVLTYGGVLNTISTIICTCNRYLNFSASESKINPSMRELQLSSKGLFEILVELTCILEKLLPWDIKFKLNLYSAYLIF